MKERTDNLNDINADLNIDIENEGNPENNQDNEESSSSDNEQIDDIYEGDDFPENFLNPQVKIKDF